MIVRTIVSSASFENAGTFSFAESWEAISIRVSFSADTCREIFRGTESSSADGAGRSRSTTERTGVAVDLIVGNADVWECGVGVGDALFGVCAEGISARWSVTVRWHSSVRADALEGVVDRWPISAGDTGAHATAGVAGFAVHKGVKRNADSSVVNGWSARFESSTVDTVTWLSVAVGWDTSVEALAFDGVVAGGKARRAGRIASHLTGVVDVRVDTESISKVIVHAKFICSAISRSASLSIAIGESSSVRTSARGAGDSVDHVDGAVAVGRLTGGLTFVVESLVDAVESSIRSTDAIIRLVAVFISARISQTVVGVCSSVCALAGHISWVCGVDVASSETSSRSASGSAIVVSVLVSTSSRVRAGLIDASFSD